MSNELPTPEAQTCDVCGQAGAVEIGESKLCAECYSEAGSSCAGGSQSEPDDLTDAQDGGNTF